MHVACTACPSSFDKVTPIVYVVLSPKNIRQPFSPPVANTKQPKPKHT